MVATSCSSTGSPAAPRSPRTGSTWPAWPGPGQAGHVDPVRGLRGAAGDPVEEHDVATIFAHEHLRVRAPRKLRGELGQLVVVCGEEGSRADAVVEILDHGPGQAHAVVGAG